MYVEPNVPISALNDKTKNNIFCHHFGAPDCISLDCLILTSHVKILIQQLDMMSINISETAMSFCHCLGEIITN